MSIWIDKNNSLIRINDRRDVGIWLILDFIKKGHEMKPLPENSGLKRRELCNLNNPEEVELLIRIAGKSLISQGTTVKQVITISDDTTKGRKRILDCIKRGYTFTIKN